MSNSSTSIMLAFFSGNGTNPIYDRIMRMTAGNYSHVEIVFNGHESCSIVQKGTVFYTKDKQFSRDGWSYLKINGLSPRAVRAMRDFCLDQHAMGAGFDFPGMSRAGSPFPKRGEKRRWFCSQLVSTALMIGGVLPETIEPSALTPAGLYKLVVKYVPPEQLSVGYNPWFEDRLYDLADIDVLNSRVRIHKSS